jgi:hypothetical protein
LVGNTYHAPDRKTNAVLQVEYQCVEGSHFSLLRSTVNIYVRKPVGLTIRPDPVIMNPGESVRMEAFYISKEKNLIKTPAPKVSWFLEGRFASISPSGQLIATSTGTGKIYASLDETRTSADLHVGRLHAAALDSFQNPDAWEITPKGASDSRGTLEPIAPGSRGNPGCILSYNLQDPNTGGIQLSRRLAVGGSPYGFRLQLFGDGSGSVWRACIRDNRDRTFTVRFQPEVNWAGEWQTIIAQVDQAIHIATGRKMKVQPPIRLESLVLSSGQTEQTEGRIGIGRLDVLYLID